MSIRRPGWSRLRRTRFYLLACVCTSVPTVAVSQDRNAEFQVVVVDQIGHPVADAAIVLEDGTTAARTDSTGRARITGPAGEFTITVRRIGFAPVMQTVPEASSRANELRVTLTSVQVLRDVRVLAEAPLPRSLESRRKNPRVTFWGPADLAKAANTRDLIGKSRGASLQGPGGDWAVMFHHPSMSGNCWADVYIDGRLSAPGMPSFGSRSAARVKFEELATMPPSHIYAIEVYPLASQAPQSIVRLRDGCGAILVWTWSWALAQMELEQRRTRAQSQGSP